MNDKKIYLQKEGLEELTKEYDDLLNKRRPEVLERVSQARNQGDLSENAEYTAARDELSFIDGRIEEIEELLKQVTLIEDTTSNGGAKAEVALGFQITVRIRNEEEEFMGNCGWGANLTTEKICHEF